MTRELMTALAVAALFAGMFAFLGVRVLNFRKGRLWRFLGMMTLIMTVAFWGMGFLPLGVIGVILMLVSGAVLIRFEMWLEPRLHDVAHRRRT